MMHGFLSDMAIAVVTASAIGILFHLLKQPVIVGYLLAGVVIGPHIGPQLINSTEAVETLSEIGIVLLLFIVGLEMEIGKIRREGKALLIPGVGQFVLSCAIGIPFFIFAGFSSQLIGAAFLAAACALSSTAIVIRSLADNKETDSLHGRISIGILVIQDLWALIALVTLPGLGQGGAWLALISIGKAVALFIGALLISRYVLSRVFVRLVRSPEMTVAASIGWCTLCAAAAAKIGLSPALGALAAGLSIASFPYHVFVRDKVEPLRDLFLLLFFVSLGLKIPAPDMALLAGSALCAAFMFASRFVTIYPLVRIAGGSGRTAFLSSLNLTQVSEFSLVILAAGAASGALSGNDASPILYLMVFTAITSSYMIRYGHRIHRVFSRKAKQPADQSEKQNAFRYPVVILGLHRGSQALIESIEKRVPGMISQLCVVDFNAEILRKLATSGIAGFLGDVSRVDTLIRAGVPHAQVVVSTIPQMLLKGTDGEQLIRTVRQLAPQASIIASADFKNQVKELEKAGADRVLLPYSIAGEECAGIVLGMMGKLLPDGSVKAPGGGENH